ncbi:glycerol-3-phosphate acyltransferase PlsY [Thermoclostridium stercorarium subsp. stercorarium DSM 8532]|uniref:Glycerol-3-phosphate acyltransferase n=3 Tax=Thermoclostridium stercorarium TaxID=1510 RepID=L7VRE7_THES1|nr:glycerol-3-phosphate 1-O-acyltransferase PlsY [Thermoclostridium stercorarium]AGC68976.1 glycerol-3-phosphate acyltransferase PlsY [Thermoclostridium stercorarium subsp. stercorarium DSM 8532]AGI39955.1 acyl-phosphate glycerol-3-phosphate acyltransferase [Thermoclostridium stercorarium subsp. stercorarium DSM 8532]UZQ84948.1 glycerol-3-phosphate 1-O-acyltransferase PlsY [Thermoclostridium stercorarium]
MFGKIVLCVVAGYLLGSLNGSLVIGKLFYKKDVRMYGSGNAGATNTLRSLGPKAAAAVTVVDLLKGILACLIGQLISGYVENAGYVGMYAAGFAAVLGHNWPIFFGFKGGKGVLTTFAVILYITPLPALICLGIFIIVVAVTRYVSLGSLIASVCWPVVSLFFNIPTVLRVLGILMVLLIVARHKDNIVRLKNHTEKRISFKGN